MHIENNQQNKTSEHKSTSTTRIIHQKQSAVCDVV